jgi:hypothetical protein
MDPRARSTLTRLLTVLLSTVAPMSRGHAEDSGKVGAVNQDATGTPPGASTRNLVIGAGVVYKEKIQTSAQGSTQILFPDQSTLNLGRNSSIVIDEYVFDPKTGTGSMVASLGKGVMRFVGGQISHTAGVTVDTPVATLGIRGGVATVVFPITADFAPGDPNLAGSSGELVIGHVGILTLKNKVSQVTIRPGFATWVSGSGVPIVPPFRISDLALTKIVAALTSHPGQTGGAGTIASPQPFIVRDGIGTAILGNPAHPPGTDPLGFTSIFGGGNDIARSKSQSNQTRAIAPPPYGAH